MRPYHQSAKEIARRLPSFAEPEHRGTVKWFNPAKCYGFITPEIGDDIFFHDSALIDTGCVPIKGDDGRGMTPKQKWPPRWRSPGIRLRAEVFSRFALRRRGSD